MEGVLEVVEYTWFEDDSCVISIIRTAYSAPRKNRVSLYLFFTPQSSSQLSFSSPDYTMLTDDCTACNMCSSEICVCPDAVAPSHLSHSNCFVLRSTNPDDNSQAGAHFYVHTWQHRYRMITRGSKRGLLTVMFNPFASHQPRQQLTMRQEFMSTFHDQHSISSRIEQQITKLLSKLPQLQSSLSATPPEPAAYAPEQSPRYNHPSQHPSQPLQQISQPSTPCTNNNSNSQVPSTRAQSLCDPSTSHSSGCNTPSKRKFPAKPSCHVPPADSSARALWFPGQSAEGICTPHASVHPNNSKVAVSQITNPSNSNLQQQSVHSSLCAPEKAGAACPCSSEDVGSDSLSLLLNSRGALLETGVMTSESPEMHAAVLQTPVPTAPLKGSLVGKLARFEKGNTSERQSGVLGNMECNSSGDSTACDPHSYRSVASRSSNGGADVGSPLNGLNETHAVGGESVLKRPRTESSVKSDTLSFSLTPGSWPTPMSSDMREKELPLPSWSLGSLPDRPLSALGRALGPGRSPSPFGLVGRLLRTPSPQPRTPTRRYEMGGNFASGAGSRNFANQSSDMSPTMESLPPLRGLYEGGRKEPGEGIPTSAVNEGAVECGLSRELEIQGENMDSRGMESRDMVSKDLGATSEAESRDMRPDNGSNDGMSEQGGLAGGSSSELEGGSAVGMKLSDGSEDNGLSCEQCGMTFAKRGNKMRHILTVHNRLKQFECDQCGAKFGLKADLGRHRFRIHESRSFTCETCGKSFVEESQLELHVRTTHEEDARPWECKMCHIRFGRKSSLTRHEQTVHQHTRFVCRVCKKSYSQRFDAIRHERKVHGLHDKGGGVPLNN